MHDFEEELKGRFKDAASTEGVDADQLWAGIAAELPESSVPAPGRKRYRWLWLSLLLLIPLFWLLLPQQGKEQVFPTAIEEGVLDAAEPSANATSNQLSSPSSATKTTSAATESTQTETLITPRIANAEAPASREGQQLIKNNKQQLAKAIENPSLPTNNPEEQAVEPTALPAPAKFTIESPAAVSERSVPEIDTKTPDLDQSQIHSTQTASDFSTTTASQVGSEREVLPLVHLDRREVLLSSNALVFNFDDPLAKVEKNQSNRFRFGAFAGLQFWSDAYAQQDDFGETLREAHSSQPGYSVSLEVGYQVRSNLEIRSGIEYVQSYTQFNWVQTWDTVMFRPDVPDTEIIDALATRTVKHQNQQQLLSIPLMLGTSLKRGRFSLGVNAGFGLNFLLNQSGKSLNSNEVITAYSQDGGGAAPFAKFFWSAQLQPYAQYQLTEGMAVQVRPSLRWQAHGDSAFFGRKHQSILSGLSIGLLF